MAKVEKRKARKDYPQQGIKAGDEYYWVKLKLQRGGITKRSLKPFKPSQLTTSSFKQGWLGVQEAWEDSNKFADDIRSAAEALRELGEETRSALENMPEGLQQGDTGQMIETRAEACENTADGLDGLADEYDELEEPQEPDDPVEDGSEDDGETPIEDDDEDSARQEYEDALSEYESEKERISSEADDLIGDMPE